MGGSSAPQEAIAHPAQAETYKPNMQTPRNNNRRSLAIFSQTPISPTGPHRVCH